MIHFMSDFSSGCNSNRLGRHSTTNRATQTKEISFSRQQHTATYQCHAYSRRGCNLQVSFCHKESQISQNVTQKHFVSKEEQTGAAAAVVVIKLISRKTIHRRYKLMIT